MNDIQLTVTPEEVEILQEALTAWEADPLHLGMSRSLISVMLCPTEERASEKLKSEQIIHDAVSEADRRKLRCLKLRCKMMEAAERPSEFSTETSPK